MPKSYTSKAELVSALESTQKQVLLYFDLPSELDLERRYSPGKWTIRQLLMHLVDADQVLLERISRGIANPGQTVYGFDQDKWASAMEYPKLSLDVARALFIATRARIIELAQLYYDVHGQNEYVHSESGHRTVKEEFNKVAWHTEHHLGQMGTALGTC